MRDPAAARVPGSRTRWFVLLLFLSQGVQFSIHLKSNHGHYLFADQKYYEIPAWNLATGHGLSLARSEWDDPYLTARYLKNHPGSDSTHIPALVVPPGYSVYLGAVYGLTGRNHTAAALANGLPLALLLVAFVSLVRRALPTERAQMIALGLGAIFPFWAFWAARIMSDTLGNALLCVAVVLWVRRDNAIGSLVCIGALLSGAILTRPYATLLPALALGLCLVFDRTQVRRALIVLFVAWAGLGLWVARNYFYFSVPLVTSTGPGAALWAARYQAERGVFSNLDEAEYAIALSETGVGDFHLVDASPRLVTLTKARISADPVPSMVAVVLNFPRLWIPQGVGFGATVRILSAIWFGLLFVTMLLGGWKAFRSGGFVLFSLSVIVAYYSLLFLPLNAEGRYMLPVRPMGFILSAYWIDQALARWRS
jgi:hypothetical protein